jgi:N-acetylneuraminate synthase
MKSAYDFKGLFICDMANNHQGDMNHGLNIIDQIGDVSNELGVRGALKFQFRHIDTFIHPDFKNKKDIKHIPRFIETRLSDDDYAVLTERVRKKGLTTIATPFDEDSLELIKKLDIEIIKVASCSATDWPLLEEIRKAGKPVILSTAGLSIGEIDRVVNFFNDHNIEFALMHCVGIYPTPTEKLLLNQISLLKRRYPEITIGFSTHEEPDYYNAIRVAYALGARLFERHVDVKAEKMKMNAYSSTPVQIGQWIKACQETVLACGPDNRPPADLQELASLKSLQRGVYAKNKIAKGVEIKRKDVFFAMPLQDNQLSSGDYKLTLKADKDYKENENISKNIALHEPTQKELVDQIMLQVRGLLNEARIHIGKNFSIEISHHYGLRRFREFGAVIIDCVNRDYCKKLIIQLPRQKHPYHHHVRKEETFLVLHGDAEIEINGDRKQYKPGDMVTIHPTEWHKFQTLNGVIFEEVSTTHFNDDSIYQDKAIAQMKREERKTVVDNWKTL